MLQIYTNTSLLLIQNAIYDSIIICFGKIFDEDKRSNYSIKSIKYKFGKEIAKPKELQQFDVNSYREIITTFNNSKAIQYYEEHFKNIRNKFIAHAQISRDEYNGLISTVKTKDLESMCDSLLILCTELLELLGIKSSGYKYFNEVLCFVKNSLDDMGYYHKTGIDRNTSTDYMINEIDAGFGNENKNIPSNPILV